MSVPSTEQMLWREEVANRPKHWVRTVTACNSRCLFCLDSDTPRNVYLPDDEVRREILRGREELSAWKIILSGGEATLHPRFPDFVRYAREVGYGRVQTVTNGWRLADREFFEACVAAGLDEITFSLHGHDEALHDHMTQHPGSFQRIVKAILRSVRSGRVITSIDVCINKQNVGSLDRIVELGYSLGVTEYDLLHVIPQASAYDNRDELFYDPREHIETLHKVFRLNRHPRFVIWTNRFPISYLEGLEDLVQDPHKMLDEVNGRRFQVRRYLDVGDPLDCRQPERCVHCFIEPFCTTMDRVVEAQREARVEIWESGDRGWAEPLPFGASLLGLRIARFADLATIGRPEHAGLALSLSTDDDDLASIPAVPRVVLTVERGAQLEAWLAKGLPDHVELDVLLVRETEQAISTQAATLTAMGERVRLVQPSWEHLSEAVAHDVRDPRAWLSRLGEQGYRLSISGLPACLAPGMRVIPERTRLSAASFEPGTGRLDIHALARHHVSSAYRAKSLRCADCAIDDRCDGAHVNMVRDQGLSALTPISVDDPRVAEARQRHPQPLSRLANGRTIEAPAPSLPGFAMPTDAPPDPLALIAAEQLVRKKKREELLARAAKS